MATIPVDAGVVYIAHKMQAVFFSD